jgi:hypothetical protein
VVELAESAGLPPMITVRWPERETITTPANFDNMAAHITRLLSSASIELGMIRAHKEAVMEW